MANKTLSTLLTFKDLIDIEHASFYACLGEHEDVVDKNGLPAIDMGIRTLKWGPAGSWKSTLSKMFGVAADVPVLTIDSSWGDAATANIPVPNMEKLCNEFYVGEWLTKFEGPDAVGIVVIDDLTTWCPTDQAKMLGGFENKRFGSRYLGPNVRTVACANEHRDAPGGWPLAKAVANRPCHIEWQDPEVHRITRWISKGGLIGTAARKERKASAGYFGFKDAHWSDEQARVFEEWDVHYAGAAGAVNGYVICRKTDPKMIRNEPDAGSPEAGRAWLSPRTLSRAPIALATARLHGLSDAATFHLIAGYTGETWATGFMQWLINQDIPNAEDFLDGTARFQHKDSRMDRTFALVSSCVSTIVPTDSTRRIARTKVFWSFLAECGDTILDGVAELVHEELFSAGLTSHRRFPEAIPTIKKLKVMMEATDVTKLVKSSAEVR